MEVKSGTGIDENRTEATTGEILAQRGAVAAARACRVERRSLLQRAAITLRSAVAQCPIGFGATGARTLLDLRSRAMKSAMPKAKTKPATANIYAVVGSDEAEVKRVAAELATKLMPPDAGDFGLEVIDGAADNADQAAARIRSTIEALQTLPFFGSTKVVWLKNANFLGDDPKARSAAVQSALEELSDAARRRFRFRRYVFDQRHRSG